MASEDPDDRKVTRLGSFIDAVFAIAITLPIVQLVPPAVGPHGDLAAAYRRLDPAFLAYTLGFTVIGLFWNYSHFGARQLQRIDHGFNLLTLLFLATVSLTPFPARPWIEHVGEPANGPVAALWYGSVLAAAAVIWSLRWAYGMRRGLYDPAIPAAYARAMGWRYALTAMAALVGVALLGAGRAGMGLTLVGAVIASFALPPSQPGKWWAGSIDGGEG